MSSTAGHPRRFLDSLRFLIKAGRGGNGYPKFGGIGGKGGDILFKGVENQTLLQTKNSRKGKRWKAEDGKPSRQFRLFGEHGKDLIIPAPLGTVIKTDTGRTLGDIINNDDEVLAARGGAGGNVDNQYAGQKGEEHHIHVLLKLIADVGLVGFPNAGKSTFLRSVSRAKPKVASYPFTTLHPTIGILEYTDQRRITLADLPGLIEGAWCNMGMGHKFLRHVERTRLLLFVIDIEGFRLGPEYPYRPPIENVILLNKELELYQPELLEKPCMLLVNKMDVKDSEPKLGLLQEQLLNIQEVSKKMPEETRPERFVSFGEVISCSAKYDPKSVKVVKERIRRVIDLYTETMDENNVVEFRNEIKDRLYDKHLRLV